MSKKVIQTANEIKSLIYMLEYLKENHFETSSKISDTEYGEIEIAIEKIFGDYSSVKKSTIYRICTFREAPKRISYKSLDVFTRWCFHGDSNYNNFEELVDEIKNQKDVSDLISDKEAKYILEKLYNKSKIVPISKNITADIGDIQVSFKLGEGYVEKLIQEVSIVTGNLLTQKIKKKPREFGVFPKQSINDRIILKEERRQNNIDRIVVKAIEFARNKEASENSVNPDWIVEFFNIAQDCSHENMQYLWAKLLASEISQPNSISRRTLSIIKLLEPKEAKVFTKLCNCIWILADTTEFKEKILIKDMYMEEQYSDDTWDFDSMFIPHLEAIGLVSESFIDMNPKRLYKLDFFGKKHEIKSSKKLAQLEITTLTRAGKEVYNIINPTPNIKYYEFTIDYFKDVNILKS